MITNSKLTFYHKEIDSTTRLEKWRKININRAWYFKKKSVKKDDGYSNSNSIDIRIPYNENKGLEVENFNMGDIVISEYVNKDINTPQDLKDFDIFYITSIRDNIFGKNPHIHMKGE